MQRPVSLPRIAAVSAAALFVASVAGFGAAFDTFSHMQHPVAALGASGVPRAGAFNVAGFVVPGLLAAVVAQMLRSRMADTRFGARLGVQVLTLAALAFAALGLLPLDSSDLMSAASRLHAAAWTAWWVAFMAGALLLAVGMRGTPHARRCWQVVACAVATLAFALLLPGLLPVGLAQRVAFAAWFAGVILLAPSGSAASSRGSSPTGPA
ncbi:DUF998 domain-containing protein [Cognatilysobacter segetis]|uniref:DUF998 domain-containing protein n=1 Tax=Cognatilysobacter segetis TaxID=2492394 RepID=UPI00105C7A6B|nr:DUF998 domain-containing protein [Lysobacter segetis]